MVKYWMHLVYYDKKGKYTGESTIELPPVENDDKAVVKASQIVQDMNELNSDPELISLGLPNRKRKLWRVTKEIFVNPFSLISKGG